MSKQLIFGQLIIPAMSHKPETVIYLEPLLTAIVLGVPWIYAIWILQTNRKRKEEYV